MLKNLVLCFKSRLNIICGMSSAGPFKNVPVANSVDPDQTAPRIANSVDPGQTAPRSSLAGVHTVCLYAEISL